MASSTNHRNLKTVYLGNHVALGDKEKARRIAKGAMALRDPLAFEDEGTPLGKIASYEVTLHHKILNGKFIDDAAIELESSILDSYLTGVAIRNLLKEQPEEVTFIVRSPEYARHHVISLEAAKAGHRVIYLGRSYNISESSSHAIAWDWSSFRSLNPVTNEFDLTKSQEVPSQRSLRRIEAHRHSLLTSKSHRVYSKSKKGNGLEVVRQLDLRKESKTVLMALSSTDEVIALRTIGAFSEVRYPGVVFASQVEWVKETISWAKARPEVDLVIRVHPREFSGQRNKTRSSMADVWESLLSDLPSNVKLNHPDQGISLYDLFTIVDVISTGWSSAGVEAVAEGIPLVLYDAGLPGYPPRLGRSGSSAEEYFRNLEAALEEEPDRESNRQGAMAWLDLQMNVGTFRVGGRLFESKRYAFPRWLTLAFEGLDRYFYFVYRPLDMVIGKLRQSETKKLTPILSGEQTSFFR